MSRKRLIDIRQPELTDEQWAKLAPLLPEPAASLRGGPRPIPNRPVVEGILWVLRNGARWKALPLGYPSASTCWRRLADWEDRGIWLEVWRTFLDTLEKRGQLRWEECFADASFAQAKKGVTEWEKPSVAKVQSGWWWSMVKVFRWHVSSAPPSRRK
jgi:transposase